jgi:alpha-ribazole phosphatase
MKIGKTIVLVRHASTAHNENGLWQGRADYPLSDTGRKEAGLLAEQLKNDAFDVIFHSPMARAIQTAEIINKHHNAEFNSIDKFIEIDLGEFDGMKHTDILKNHPEIHRNWVLDIDSPIPGGESFIDIFNRVKPGVEQILASPYHSILIVAHAMVNRAILGHIIGIDPIPSRKFRMDNAAYSRFIVYESPFGKYTALDSWNITSHLASAKPRAYEHMEKKEKTR